MKYQMIIDEKVAVWARTSCSVEANSLNEAVEKCKDGEYETDSYEYLTETEEKVDSPTHTTVEIYKKGSDKILYAE